MYVASCSSLSLAVSLFLGPALTLQPAVPASPSPPTPSPSFVCHCILTFFQTVQLSLCMTFLHLHCCTSSLVLYRSVCDTRSHSLTLPAETLDQSHQDTPTCPWSTFRRCTSRLLAVPSQLLRMCGFFSSSHHDIASLRDPSHSDQGPHIIRTPEFCAPVHSFHGLEWYGLLTPSL